ncbi:hypothetical protein F4561_000042 [Lipingzhangella halophila]|uniref:Uncharacterized protein n=1 Tax=Lipingzhangella halophila TaxID=1783352 RepID=A0A7W7RC27_9ACTN|nr:hypothetical protein [Lipingzhangella halophila]MBB4929222.1 hypothetical protein [Lipingzhangella halophila]
MAIGVICGLFAALISTMGGLSLGYQTTSAVAMGVPMAIAGGGYCVLLALGWFQIGTVGPMAAYWAVCFPLARLIHEVAMATTFDYDTILREPLWSFLLFQAMLSVGFAIGFLWLHERLMPRWLLRIEVHNPFATALLDRYSAHANTMLRRKEERTANKEKPSSRS